MKNLKILRENARITQQKLANDLGISQSNICEYEKGTIEATESIILKIADYFNTTTDYLLKPTNQNKISTKLKELRNNKNLTQKEVAKSLKISTTCYAGYEQGYREPNADMIIKICIFFNISADYLLGIKDILCTDKD